MNADGANLKAITSGDVDSYTPTWSPSGGMLAYSSPGSDGRQDIWRANGDGSGAVDLSAGGAEIEFGIPVWAPSGSRIAFETVDDSASKTRLGTVAADGTDARIVPGVDRLAFHDWGVKTPSGTTNECNDGKDNDADGKIDIEDPDCADGGSSETPLGQCLDGKDNDGDGKVDAADPDCANGGTSEFPPSTSQCDDGIDNDGDGKIDAADPECADGGTSETPPAPTGCPPEAGPISGILLDPVAPAVNGILTPLGDVVTQVGCLVYDLLGL